MSVERAGAKWRVRWRDFSGEHSKRVSTKRDAQLLDGEIKRRKALGGFLDVDRGTETLEQFYTEHYVPRYALPVLQASTRGTQKGHWNHIRHAVGSVRLRELSPRHGAALAEALGTSGLAPLTIRSILSTLQGILNRAVEWEHIDRNPLQGVRRPRARRRRTIRPLPPVLVERIRAELDTRGATIVSLMAYSGVRPAELRQLTWDLVRERTLWIPDEISKNGLGRTVRLFGPLSEDLLLWRAACPVTHNNLIMPSTHAHPWSHNAYNQWHSRYFLDAAKATGWTAPRAYDLRHSFVSLLIQAGYQILDVARQAGHRPEECLRTYAHLFDEWAGDRQINPEEAIYAAR